MVGDKLPKAQMVTSDKHHKEVTISCGKALETAP